MINKKWYSLLVAVLIGLGMAVAPIGAAAAASSIRCSTLIESVAGRVMVVRVVSNKRIYDGQTSAIGYYRRTSSIVPGRVVMDEGYGVRIRLVRPVDSYSWDHRLTRAWHAGTACSRPGSSAPSVVS